jgi:hypothetical protein
MHPADYQSPKSIYVSGAVTGVTAPQNSYFYKIDCYDTTTFSSLIAVTGAHCVASNYSVSSTGITGATGLTAGNFAASQFTQPIYGKFRAFSTSAGTSKVIAYYA